MALVSRRSHLGILTKHAALSERPHTLVHTTRTLYFPFLRGLLGVCAMGRLNKNTVSSLHQGGFGVSHRRSVSVSSVSPLLTTTALCRRNPSAEGGVSAAWLKMSHVFFFPTSFSENKTARERGRFGSLSSWSVLSLVCSPYAGYHCQLINSSQRAGRFFPF